MKRLDERIMDIDIRGGAGMLTDIVKQIDISMQTVSQNTEDMYDIAVKYSGSNVGQQYDKMVKTLNIFREILFTASIEVNDIQTQLVNFQNKIYRYEDLNQFETIPNPHLVERRKEIAVDVRSIKFSENEMRELSNCLKIYCEAVSVEMKKIVFGKNNLANVWRDTQYDDFSVFIDGISQTAEEGIKEFADYVEYLDSKIKELAY